MNTKNNTENACTWMAKLRIVAVAITVSFAVGAHAGNEVGNGGDAIVCPNGDVLFYDVFEAEDRHGLKPEFSTKSTELEKAEEIIRRIEKLNPRRAQIYLAWLKEFYANTKFIKGRDLVDIPDTGAGAIPSGCQIKQLIVQDQPRLPGDKLYTISEDLWKNLSADHKAAALVHELILREARLPENAHFNSQFSRYLNAHLHNIGPNPKISLRRWHDILKESGFAYADAHGFPIRLLEQKRDYPFPQPFGEVEYYDDDRVHLAVIGKGEFDLRGSQISADETQGHSVEFYPDSTLKFARSLRGKISLAWGQSKLVNQSVGSGALRFYPNGLLQEVLGSAESFVGPGLKIVKPFGPKFYPDGTVADMNMDDGLFLYGNQWTVIKGAIRFYADGTLKEVFWDVPQTIRTLKYGNMLSLQSKFDAQGFARDFYVPVPTPMVVQGVTVLVHGLVELYDTGEIEKIGLEKPAKLMGDDGFEHDTSHIWGPLYFNKDGTLDMSRTRR